MNPQPLSRIDDEYELVYEQQDVRGWPVRDLGGRLLGRVQDFLVDTDHRRVTSLVLDSGVLCPVGDISIADGVVLLDDRAQAPAAALADRSQAPAPALADRAQVPALVLAPPLDGQRLEGTDAGAMRLPVIEEEIRISKREVPRGGVRVTTHLAERPVQEQVTLREEHVHVERRPVDQPVAPPADAFERRTLDVIERAEQPVAAKQARVVEEIVVGKETTARTEQIEGTVRRTEVDVKPLADFDLAPYEAHYQQHFAPTGIPFSRFVPAYRFGHELHRDPQLASQSWQALEPTARRQWEAHSPGTWGRFREAVYHGWHRTLRGLPRLLRSGAGRLAKALEERGGELHTEAPSARESTRPRPSCCCLADPPG